MGTELRDQFFAPIKRLFETLLASPWPDECFADRHCNSSWAVGTNAIVPVPAGVAKRFGLGRSMSSSGCNYSPITAMISYCIDEQCAKMKAAEVEGAAQRRRKMAKRSLTVSELFAFRSSYHMDDSAADVRALTEHYSDGIVDCKRVKVRPGRVPAACGVGVLVRVSHHPTYCLVPGLG